MTKDIDQLLKIADGLDNSGLFGASEAVSGVIQHIANKLSSDNYRAFTKKIREGAVFSSKKAQENMVSQLLAIAAQFDAEGNFDESDRITSTAKAMLKKKVKK